MSPAGPAPATAPFSRSPTGTQILDSMPAINRHGYVAGQEITKRLDVLGHLQSGCLGVSWWFVRVFVLTGGAWAMAAAQTGSFNYLSKSVEADFPMTSAQGTLVSGAIMLGAFVGALGFGSLADTHGRKFSLLIAFTLTHSAGALCAVSPNIEVLALFRLALGLGLGGQPPAIYALMMELAPTSIRGRVLVSLDAFWPLGSICMVLLCREVEPLIGWQAVSALSASALLYLPLLYYCVPESPKWLASAGEFDEAVRVLRVIEQASSVFHSEDVDDAIKRPPYEEHDAINTKHAILVMHKPSFLAMVATRVRLLLRFPYLGRTLMLWFVWTGLAISNSVMWDHLHEHFVTEVSDPAGKALLIYGVLVAQLVGNQSACALIDRIGRKFTIISFLVLECIASLLEVYVVTTMALMLLFSCLRNAAFFGAIGCLYTYTPELYPTSIRVIGIGYAWGISRLGAFAGPYAVLWMMDNNSLYIGAVGVMWVFSGLVLCVALAIFAFGIETAGYDAEKASRSSSSLATTSELHHDSSTTAMLAYQRHSEGERKVASQPVSFL